MKRERVRIAHAVGSLARPGVTVAAVSNWRRRRDSFSVPYAGIGDRFSAEQVTEWLDGRKITVNDLMYDEPPGISYGDRYRRNLSDSWPVAPQPTSRYWRMPYSDCSSGRMSGAFLTYHLGHPNGASIDSRQFQAFLPSR
jgi:hypothetical protein